MKTVFDLLIAGHLSVVLLGCADSASKDIASVTKNIATARAEFKSISDGKKTRVTEVLSTNNSELHKYEATVTEETDVEKSGKYPYIGRIKFSYRISEVDEKVGQDSVVRWYSADELTAAYRYSAREGKWIYDGAFQSDASEKDVIEPNEILVAFETVLAAFEER